MKGHRDLSAVAAASVLCALAALVLPFPAICLVLAVPLALILPGYAITAAIFARRQTVEWPQALLLSVGLSLVTLALGGLLLNYVPGGIHALSWAVLLLLVVLNGCRTAALRRPEAPAGAPQWPRLHVTVPGAGLLLGALAMTIAALVLAFTTLPASNARGYTQLWLLPAKAPRQGVLIGVASDEQNPTTYTLRVRVGDRPNSVVRHFSLDPGRRWFFRLRSESPLKAGQSIPVSAALFAENDPHDVYRRVSGWMSGPRAR